jgi:hypothetical protein
MIEFLSLTAPKEKYGREKRSGTLQGLETSWSWAESDGVGQWELSRRGNCRAYDSRYLVWQMAEARGFD